MTGPKRQNWRLLVFASGDFAFNLYWQSVMLYLLFYYTEELHLPIALASLGYALASIWDGIASLLVGVLADRLRRPERYRAVLLVGAVPLGLSFVLAYTALPVDDERQFVWILAGHLLFRTLYALVNIPYLAMSARISLDSDDRALVVGARMLFGTLAAVIVAVGTVPLGKVLSGGSGKEAFLASAAAFAIAGTVLLIVVGLTYRDADRIPAGRTHEAVRGMIAAVMSNRAFLVLSAAAMAMIVAVTGLDKSVLYYFKYALDDEQAGQLTLGWMMAISGVAIPLWWWIARRFGARNVWFMAVVACLVCLVVFIALAFDRPMPVQVFLVAVQASIVGLHFSFWAMLPDTVEYGQRTTGVRGEAVLYGLSALFQRLAIGLGTLLVGIGLGGEGLHHAEAGDATYKMVLAVIPLCFFALAGLVMLANPLRRGSHGQILDELRRMSSTRD